MARRTNGQKNGGKSDGGLKSSPSASPVESTADDGTQQTPPKPRAKDSAQDNTAPKDAAPAAAVSPSAKTGTPLESAQASPTDTAAQAKTSGSEATANSDKATDSAATIGKAGETAQSSDPRPSADAELKKAVPTAAGTAAKADVVPGEAGQAKESATQQSAKTGAGGGAAAAPAASIAAPGPISSTPPRKPDDTPAAAPQARGGVFPLVLGGILAGGIGYGASFLMTEQDVDAPTAHDIASLQDEVQSLRSALSGRAAQDDVASVQSELSTLRDAIDAQTAARSAIDATLATLGTEVEELRNALSDLPATPGDIGAATRGDVNAFAEVVSTLEAQFAAIQSEMSELRSDVSGITSALRADMEDLRDLSERRVVEAEAQVDDALARSGLEIMTAALATGRSYADALGLFRDAGVDLPEALAVVAATGVPTLEALQERFPPAARAALRAEYAQAPADTAYDRVANFLRAQTGARSTAPKEGDDTDAVLSRAGAAIEDGAFEAALAELDSLTDPARAAMQGWISDLRTRLDAEAALAEFTTSLSNE